jgi:hypothetical protein
MAILRYNWVWDGSRMAISGCSILDITGVYKWRLEISFFQKSDVHRKK